MRLLAVAVACLGLALVAFVPTAGARTRHCAFIMGQGPKNDRFVPLGRVVTHNMYCSKALAAIRSGTLTRSGNLKTAGFACQVTKSFRAGKVLTGASVRCAKRTRWFSFSWAT